MSGYNEETVSKLKDDIKAHWNHIKHNEKTPLYMKICMVIYKTIPKLFYQILQSCLSCDREIVYEYDYCCSSHIQ